MEPSCRKEYKRWIDAKHTAEDQAAEALVQYVHCLLRGQPSTTLLIDISLAIIDLCEWQLPDEVQRTISWIKSVYSEEELFEVADMIAPPIADHLNDCATALDLLRVARARLHDSRLRAITIQHAIKEYRVRSAYLFVLTRCDLASEEIDGILHELGRTGLVFPGSQAYLVRALESLQDRHGGDADWRRALINCWAGLATAKLRGDDSLVKVTRLAETLLGVRLDVNSIGASGEPGTPPANPAS